MTSPGKDYSIIRTLKLWLPVLLQMGLIFFFSSRPAGDPVLREFPLSAPLGHLAGYFLLAFLLYRAINRGSFNWSVKAAGYCLLIGFLYALSDEFHQLYVPGREASLVDVVYDLAGIMGLLALVRIYSHLKTPPDSS